MTHRSFVPFRVIAQLKGKKDPIIEEAFEKFSTLREKELSDFASDNGLTIDDFYSGEYRLIIRKEDGTGRDQATIKDIREEVIATTYLTSAEVFPIK